MPKSKRKLESAGSVSDFPIIINGQALTSKQCAQFAHNVLRNAGYLAQGNAWDSVGSDVVYSGYDVKNRPKNYDSLAVMNYNSAASDSLYKNFDSNTLDKSRPYLVNMYYKGSKHLKEAYDNGTKDRTGTHTGYLIHDGNQWNVVHNIDGTAHVDRFTSIQGGNKKYGVTSVLAPRKNTIWNTVKTRLGFKDGGSIHIAPSKRGTFTAAATKHGMGVQEFARRVLANRGDYSPAMVKKANFARNAKRWKYGDGGGLFIGGELPEVIVTGYAPLRLTTYYPVTSEYPYTGHSKLDIPIDRQTWYNYTGEEPSSDRIVPYMTIDKTSSAKDYNLVTNNCADATLSFLNNAFGTSEKPLLFTTPGDVRDYALKELNGKLIKNNDGSDTVLIPRNAKTAGKISTTALNMFDKDLEGTAYVHYKGPFSYTKKYKQVIK